VFEFGAADLELTFGIDEVGLRTGEACLRLGDVGAGQLADLELLPAWRRAASAARPRCFP
jgi:hypothetical protein